MLLANVMGEVADAIFGQPAGGIGPAPALYSQPTAPGARLSPPPHR